MYIRMALIIMFALLSGMASGEEVFSPNEIYGVLQQKINAVEAMAKHPGLIKAVKDQNARKMGLEEIQQIDAEWKSTDTLTPFKESMQTCDAGEILKKKLEPNKTIYSEAILTDNQGANVAAHPVTTDYWQGDEEKWISSFNDGNGQVYIGPIEFDESTQAETSQISVPIFDEEETIGVLVVGVKLSYIEAKILREKI